MAKPTQGQSPPRLRLTSTIDLDKAKPGCKHCHGTGVRGHKTIDNPEDPGNDMRVPLICRCVTRRGGVAEDALDRIAKQMSEELEGGQFGQTMARDVMNLPGEDQRLQAIASLETFAMDRDKAAKARKAAVDALFIIREQMREESQHGDA